MTLSNKERAGVRSAALPPAPGGLFGGRGRACSVLRGERRGRGLRGWGGCGGGCGGGGEAPREEPWLRPHGLCL